MLREVAPVAIYLDERRSALLRREVPPVVLGPLLCFVRGSVVRDFVAAGADICVEIVEVLARRLLFFARVVGFLHRLLALHRVRELRCRPSSRWSSGRSERARGWWRRRRRTAAKRWRSH